MLFYLIQTVFERLSRCTEEASAAVVGFNAATFETSTPVSASAVGNGVERCLHLGTTLIQPVPPVTFILPGLDCRFATLGIPIVRMTRLVPVALVVKHLQLVQAHFERLGSDLEERASAVEDFNLRALEFPEN